MNPTHANPGDVIRRRALSRLPIAAALALGLLGTTACSDSYDQRASGAPTVDATLADTAQEVAATATGIPSEAVLVDADQRFVGSVADSDIYVAVNVTEAADSASGETEVEFYFCDDAALALSSWGTLDGSRLTTDVVDATVDGTVVTGTVRIAGETLDFTAEPATGAAGLYTADIVDALAETFTLSGFWVRHDDDTFRGIQNGGSGPVQLGGIALPTGNPPRQNGGLVETEEQKTCRRLARIQNRTRLDALHDVEPGSTEYWAAATEFSAKGCDAQLLL